MSAMGIETAPPSDRLANSASASWRLSALTVTEKLLPNTGGGPNVDGASLPISTLPPMGRDTCMMLSRSASGMPISAGPSPNVWMISNSPPNTDR